MTPPDTTPSYVRFRTALKGGEVGEAFEVAKRLPGRLPLLDALELTLLAARAGWEAVFQECAARWLARVAVEKGLTFDELADAAGIFQAAAEEQEGGSAYKALADLL